MSAPESHSSTETPAGSRGYALFDLDHTLLPFDTQVFFANHVMRREGWRRFYLLIFLPLVPLGAVGLLSLRVLKRVFSCYLWGMSRERLKAHAEAFVAGEFSRACYPELRAEVERHRSAGRSLILNTASPSIYVAEIAAHLGFDHWLATDMEVRDVMPFFPRIGGPNNKHGAKVEAMAARGLLPPGCEVSREGCLPDSWGYSDSSADLPMLGLCRNVLMVHPSPKLAAFGEPRGWKTVKPPRPYGGRWGNLWAIARMLFGLYRPSALR